MVPIPCLTLNRRKLSFQTWRITGKQARIPKSGLQHFLSVKEASGSYGSGSLFRDWINYFRLIFIHKIRFKKHLYLSYVNLSS